MDTLFLFTDGSVDTKSRIGFGAILAVSNQEEISTEKLASKIILKRFEKTSSSKLELQTLVWALGIDFGSNRKLIVYTDSQNILSLPGRREKLEQSNYMSKKGRLLSNFELYRIFFKFIDKIDVTFKKVRGHKKSDGKDEIDRVFALVDRASRSAIRNEIKKR